MASTAPADILQLPSTSRRENGGAVRQPDTNGKPTPKPLDEPASDTSADDGDSGTSDTLASYETNMKPQKRNSFQVRLEESKHKGRYILTADDPEIKEILRKGIERQEIEAGTKKARHRFRDHVFTRQFTTFDRQNQSASHSAFFGFFTLFWIAMVLLFVQFSMHNYRDYGSILGSNQIMKLMMSRDVLLLGITDGVMCAACVMTLFLQKVVQRGWLHWERGGWIVQNLWQTFYLAAVVEWTYYREWPWTHTIFIVLHAMVFIMKQHSFAFTCGYLSVVQRRRAALQRKLQQLDQMEPIASPPSSPVTLKHAFPDLSTGFDSLRPDQSTLTHRRASANLHASTDFSTEHSTIATIAQTITSNHPLTTPQMETFSSLIHAEIADLTRDLTGQATTPATAYPHNLTLANYTDYICLPTLVYELAYPRQETINYAYVAEKLTATFGVLCVMMVISQAFIYPPVARTVAMKAAGATLEQRWAEFPFVVSDILFPLLIEQLLTWYLIWECILNLLAELTRFSNRDFYGDWWNSVTWDQYARDWNRPVHNFLLRHVYHSSISTFHLSRNAATFVTFLLSALVHEMCMAIMFKKIRGYLFVMQLAQMPLVAFSRSKVMKDRRVLGNVIFWVGLFVGPSVLTALYLVI